MGNKIFKFGPFRLNTSTRELKREISGRGMDLLVYLLESDGKAIKRKTIIDDVWKNISVGDNSLSQQISDLRRILGDKPNSPEYVETTGDGYVKFGCPVEVVSQTEDEVEKGNAAGLGPTERQTAFPISQQAAPNGTQNGLKAWELWLLIIMALILAGIWIVSMVHAT